MSQTRRKVFGNESFKKRMSGRGFTSSILHNQFIKILDAPVAASERRYNNSRSSNCERKSATAM
ncbi:hypothetical protein FQR65_LT09480 [Abscondita terminalis]|nr:hypothetical protein FQR65_LT09480 [Abscondita terminalis]